MRSREPLMKIKSIGIYLLIWGCLQAIEGYSQQDMIQQYMDVLKGTPANQVVGLPVPSITMHLEFEYNSAKLTQQAKQELNSLASALQDETLRQHIFRVEGHTCNLGNPKYNLTLSLHRAQSVASYLVEKTGLSPDQFEVKGYGESQPVVDNSTEANRQKNRRVVFLNTLRKLNQ